MLYLISAMSDLLKTKHFTFNIKKQMEGQIQTNCFPLLLPSYANPLKALAPHLAHK